MRQGSLIKKNMADRLRLTFLFIIFGIARVKASSSDLEPLEPILCPHDDPYSNTCYELTSENRTCTVITFGPCNNDGNQTHWWIQHLCWSVRQDNCTMSKCEKTCCDGWTTDSDGRCDKPITDNEIACENGLVNWDDDKPKCECWSNYYGDKCDTLVIGNAWDVESNPGPTSRNDSSHFPCGLNNVGWEDRGICCDTCNVWYHIGCQARCEGGCKNGGTCIQKIDGSHQCHCPPPFTGSHCQTVTCLEECMNGGTCVSNGAEAVCACPLNYYGKTCKHEIDGTLCPMPNNTDCRRVYSGDECINTAGCQDGLVCCSDGCRMRCLRPVTKTCQLDNRYYRAGEMFSKDACNHCTCMVNGTVVCSEIKCPDLECSGGKLTYEDDLCCPVCRGNDIRPDDYSLPAISRCYHGVVVPVNLSRNSNTYYLASLGLEAWDYTGSKLQVNYSPKNLTHCRCVQADRITHMVSVSAVDRYGGRTECNFWAYLLDPIPPVFISCPAEIYAYETEPVRWDAPRAQDNVDIWYMWSTVGEGETLPAGEHTITYTAIDFDSNQATCEFNVYVYSEGTPESQLPAGMRCRKKKTSTGRIVGGIIGGLMAVILVLSAILIIRIHRRKIQRSRQRSTRGAIHTVSNEQYSVGMFPDYKSSSTKPPEYTPPNNPPAYDELNSPDAQDYKFANPPQYDELSLGGEDTNCPAANGTDNIGVYEQVDGVERRNDSVSNPTYGSGIDVVGHTPRQTVV